MGERLASGERGITEMPFGRFSGASCALAELTGVLPEAADYRAAPLCTGDPDDLVLRLADMPGEKIAKVKVGLMKRYATAWWLICCWRLIPIRICV